jgi:hypothetical protein
MKACFITLVVISIPLTYFLAITLNWRIFGIFFSFGFCNLLLIALYVVKVSKVDLVECAELISKRLHKEN